MKHVLPAVLVLGLMALMIVPAPVAAGPLDTLVVYATTGASLDAVVSADTLTGGVQKHLVYKLPSHDTTYIFLGTMTLKSSVTFLGVLGTNGRPPCIQPGVLGDGSLPPTLFTVTGKGISVKLKNLYLLAAGTNNTVNGGGIAVQVSADSVALAADGVVFDGWQSFAIGYNGNWDKFVITGCRFRNMIHPNQWYIGEVLRNEWPGAAYTDSVIFRNNTLLCINGYASATVTKYYTKYFEFTHNTFVHNFKNPFFEFNVTSGKWNNNILYALHGGGISKAEYPWWDQLWSPEISSVIDIDTLDLAKDSLFNPTDIGKPDHRMLSEAKRTVEVKNNAYFWPAAMTSMWHAWNDTAHVDSVYTTSWMNTRTQGFFSNKTVWPGFTESGNLNADPGFGSGVASIMTGGTGFGVGFSNFFAGIRRGTALTDMWGYKLTEVGPAANWVPTWPLPEAADMVYSNAALKTGGTDGKPIGDYTWSGLTDVEETVEGMPVKFELFEAYPNPFNPSTNIQFTLPATANVSLKVYNVLGQEVAMLANGPMEAGRHTLAFNANGLSSGVYFYTLTAGNFVSSKKMMLLK